MIVGGICICNRKNIFLYSSDISNEHNTALHKDEQTPPHPPPSHVDHPSGRTWISPNHKTLPITDRGADMQPLPLHTEGGTIPSDTEGHGSSSQNLPLDLEGVGRSSLSEGQSLKTRTRMRKTDVMSDSEDEENKGSKFMKSVGEMETVNLRSNASKPPILLPPSAFTSAATSGAVQGNDLKLLIYY